MARRKAKMAKGFIPFFLGNKSLKPGDRIFARGRARRSKKAKSTFKIF